MVQASEQLKQASPFGPNEERGIISAILDVPEIYHSIGDYLDHKYFRLPEAQYIYLLIKQSYDKHGVVPSRQLIVDNILRDMTVDDNYSDVVELAQRESDPREIPIIRDILLKWAKHQAYGLLFSEDALSAYEQRNYDQIDEVVDKAHKIVDISARGFWFFKDYKKLFSDDVEAKLTSGFPELDRYINEGGPTAKELFIWMAPTNGGKSAILVNSALFCVRRGHKVLYVTLELSETKTGMRALGVISKIPIIERRQKRHFIEQAIEQFKSNNQGDLVIYEFPPEEISVDAIYQLISLLRRQHGWSPDIVVIDYLDLLLSRKSYNNKEDYIRQKRVSTEMRGLAKNENVLVFSATQTNRDSISKGIIELDKVAESYGKIMPVDYCVSINLLPTEYRPHGPSALKLYIAKNRNGPKFITIDATVDFSTMVFRIKS